MNRNTDLKALPIGREEGFLLSRLDGSTPWFQLEALTGLPTMRVRSILMRLVELGAVEPGAFTPIPEGTIKTKARMTPVPEAALETAEASEPEGAPAPDTPPGQTVGRASVKEDSEEAAGLGSGVAGLGARGLFGQHLRHLEEGERVSRAEQARDPELSAFCFDPLPSVARALLANPRFTQGHARMFARYHQSPPGLEQLCSRVALVRDSVVERSLLRNPRLPGAAAHRLLSGRGLLKLWLLHVDREVPEQVRQLSKVTLRSRFGSVPAEERVDLLLRSEGRVLGTLSGLSVDGRTTSLLCQRSFSSPLLIQNLARWNSCPAQLLVHLWNQPIVRAQFHLRQSLMRHTNLPAELKREAS